MHPWMTACLAVDMQGRLLAGSVVGHDLWEVDRNNAIHRVKPLR